MINTAKLSEVLEAYKKQFVNGWWDNECYKWEAIKCFKDNWKVDADNFCDMLHKSLDKTYNLLASINNYPRKMIETYASEEPETVRGMFISLFDEGRDVYSRIKEFKEKAEILRDKYNCLRTYKNQRLHNHIKRGLAKAALTTIINNIHEKNLHYTLSSPSLGYSKDLMKTIQDYGLISGEDSKEILDSLFKEINRQKASLPSGFGYTLSADKDNITEYADFAWPEKNILLFTLNNIKSYENMVNSQNKFKCYLLTSSFDYVKFVTEVNE